MKPSWKIVVSVSSNSRIDELTSSSAHFYHPGSGLRRVLHSACTPIDRCPYLNVPDKVPQHPAAIFLLPSPRQNTGSRLGGAISLSRTDDEELFYTPTTGLRVISPVVGEGGGVIQAARWTGLSINDQTEHLVGSTPTYQLRNLIKKYKLLLPAWQWMATRPSCTAKATTLTMSRSLLIVASP